MVNSVKPIVVMIVVQAIYAAMITLFKMVANAGMSLHVLVAYRLIFSAAFIVPFALLFERKSMQNLTGKVLFQAFLCGLLGGSLFQNLFSNALALLPTLYTTTMFNLIPAITYFMAISLRLEKPNLETPAGKAKLLGTLVGIGGAMILSLYEGKKLFTWSTHIDLLQHMASPPQGAPTGSRLWGFVLALAASLSYSSWLIIQGIFGSGVVITLIAWCVHLKGPLFVSAFSPLMLVLVAFAGTLVLNEYITIGSLTGATLIVIGLYMLLWGKSKETRMEESEILVSGKESEILVSEKDSVQICNSIHIANSSLACN